MPETSLTKPRLLVGSLQSYLAHHRQPEKGQGLVARRKGLWRPLLALLVTVGLGFFWQIVEAGGGAKTAPSPLSLYQDLRDRQPLRPDLVLSGKDVDEYTVLEPQGYRITLPAGRKAKPPRWGVGVQPKFQVDGDFQITGSYELLAADVPSKPQDVVGVNLFIMRAPESKRFGRLGRFNTTEGPVYEVRDSDYTLPRKRTPTQNLRVPTQAKQGQLRLVREGTVLSYLVKDAATNGAFKELFKAEFGAGALNVILYEVTPGEDAGAVDGRLVDLRIHQGSQAAEMAETLPVAAAPEGTAATIGWKVWLALALVIVLSMGVAFALHRVRLTRRSRARAGATGMEAPSAAPVAFACSGCGKRLKVRAELAGKKVKCPQCGAAVPVPGADFD